MDSGTRSGKSDNIVLEYLPDEGRSIYLEVDPNQFPSHLEELVVGMGFVPWVPSVDETAKSFLDKRVEQDSQTKILKLRVATPNIPRQIRVTTQSDPYGEESITFKGHYHVYRYHRLAMIIYSYNASWWEGGVFQDFGAPSNIDQGRIIINRFLSWALLPHGFIGFWGRAMERGGLVTTSRQANGEAMFINIEERKLLLPTGGLPLGADFKIFRSDPIAKNNNRPIPPEELLSYLHYHHTFMDYLGPTTAVRQMLQAISQRIPGHKRDLKMVTKSVPLEDAST